MKKRLFSLFVAIVMIFSIFGSVPVVAADQDPTLGTATGGEVTPGDTTDVAAIIDVTITVTDPEQKIVEIGSDIVYTVSIGAVEGLAGVKFTLDIPEELELKEKGESSIGGSREVDTDKKTILIKDVKDYTSKENTDILVFICKANKVAEQVVVGITKAEFAVAATDCSYNINNENAGVEIICKHPAYVDVVDEVYLKSDANCTSKAVYYKSCEKCGAASETETFEYGDIYHAFKDYVYNNDATCTKDGTKTGKCENCTETYTIPDPDHKMTGHSWIPATCTTPETCKNCNETRGTVSDHNWIAATCTTPETCKDCGTTNGEELGHEFINYVSNNNATCTAEGTKTAECERCDEKKTIVDEGSKGHIWADATCTTPKTCTRENCNATDGEALGHDFGEPVKQEKDLCTDKVKTVAECSRCDATKVEELDEPVGEHKFVENEAKAPTCTEKGWDAYTTCSECKYTTYVEIAATGHTATVNKGKAATCTETGLTDGSICSVCNTVLEVQKEIPALGHDFVNYIPNGNETCVADGTKTAKCERCDATDTVVDEGSGGHKWVDATCTTVKYCSVCKTEEGTALGHEFKNYVSNNNATCTADGTKTAKCERCDEKDTVIDEGSMSHKWAEATCTEPKKCVRENCDATEGEPNGHKYGEYVYNNDATCTEDGTKTGKCSVCGESHTEADATHPATGHKWVDANCTAPKTCSVCKATEGEIGDHKFEGYVYNNDATCTEAGTKTAKCANCDETNTIEDTTHPATEHKWVDATCTTPKTCSSCKKTDGDALGHKWVDATCTTPKTCSVCEETDGDAPGHKFEKYASNNDVTCSTKGTKTAKCENCDVTNTVTDEDTALLAHTYGEYVSNNDATCTKDGTKSKVCSVCKQKGETVTDEGSAGHTWTAATCTTPKTCSVCELTEGDVLGHKFAYSCVEDGSAIGTCTRENCDKTHVKEKADSADHTWVDATCAAPKTCSVCKATEGEKLAHTWTAATCTAPKTCSVCNATDGEALGHDWNAATDTVPKTCKRCETTGDVTVKLIITADKTEAKGGDTITYTVALGPVYKLAGVEFQMAIPDGLTFVSGALADGIANTLGAGSCNFNSGSLKVTIGNINAYTSDKNTPILTIQCKVNSAFSGNVVMGVNKNASSISDIYAPATVVVDADGSAVAVACSHAKTTKHAATESTCKTPGHAEYTSCDNCGAVVSGDNTALELKPDNHVKTTTYAAVKSGTCQNPGHEEYTSCDECGKVLAGSDEPIITAHGSSKPVDEKYIKTPATCTNVAVYYKSCELCGMINTTSTFTAGELAPHTYSEATCTAAKTCTACGATDGDPLGHSWIDATYEKPKTCERCGIEEGDLLSRVSVSGTVTSFGSATENVSIQLLDASGKTVYTATVTGTSSKYTISGVEAGTYTMKVSKPGHTTRTYIVTVGTEDVTQDAAITVVGDVNFDGVANVVDCNMLYNHADGSAVITDAYALSCADVNSDSKTDMSDYDELFNIVLGV